MSLRSHPYDTARTHYRSKTPLFAGAIWNTLSSGIGTNLETNALRIRNSGNNMPYLVKVLIAPPDDPEMAAFVNSYIDLLNDLVADATDNRFNNIMDVVAQADFSIKYTPEFQETPMGNFVADAVRIIASEKTGNRVDLAIQANGNIRGDIETWIG